ncbi:KGG domain-containing protein [Nitrosomonas eutropha]|uniref:Stress-induced acidophilic repeat motif-containing protein n=2 Tax=Nitrosomonas eutropha TaxID=916 RepID=A0ABX5M5Q3_9PROT|nr:KGG domain-containing protein [Nitrosomonas eutropha]ABI59577.1 conserved hypothetical protein [Nitrosomonas eutropha C91]PXV79794.1 hypothetical protein C8R14_1205 [Nitrosomonas eutropha]
MATGKNQDNDNSNKGFASMDEDKQRQIASKGGKAAHEKGAAHEFDSEEAREAGKKGGQSSSSSAAKTSGNTANTSTSGKSKKDDDDDSPSHTRGGTSKQHSDAGKQSHKNDK